MELPVVLLFDGEEVVEPLYGDRNVGPLPTPVRTQREWVSTVHLGVKMSRNNEIRFKILQTRP